MWMLHPRFQVLLDEERNLQCHIIGYINILISPTTTKTILQGGKPIHKDWYTMAKSREGMLHPRLAGTIVPHSKDLAFTPGQKRHHNLRGWSQQHLGNFSQRDVQRYFRHHPSTPCLSSHVLHPSNTPKLFNRYLRKFPTKKKVHNNFHKFPLQKETTPTPLFIIIPFFP